MFPMLPDCGTLRDSTQNISGVREGEWGEEEKWEKIEIGMSEKTQQKMNSARQNWTQQKRIGCNSKTWNMKYE